MSALVVYYSRAGENYWNGKTRYLSVGNTDKAAHIIAEAAKAQLYQIRQKEPYSTQYRRCTEQALADKQAGARPELEALPISLKDFETISLCYPNYWGDLPMAVYTFLEAFDWEGKTIYPFCTHEGSGLSGTDNAIAHVCPGAFVTNPLAVRGSEVDKRKADIARWAKRERPWFPCGNRFRPAEPADEVSSSPQHFRAGFCTHGA